MRTRLVLTAAATALAAGGVTAVLVPSTAGAAGTSTESVLSAAEAALEPATTDQQGRRGKRLLSEAQRRELRSTGHLTLTRQTKRRGAVTVAIQLGQVTAITPTSVTLRSKDGYTHTYALTDKTKVRVRRVQAAVSDVTVGARGAVIALVGKDGDQVRRLVIRPAGTGRQLRPGVASPNA